MLDEGTLQGITVREASRDLPLKRLLDRPFRGILIE